MKLLVLTSALLLNVACNAKPAELEGNWGCKTTSVKGAVTYESYTFKPNGSFVSRDEEYVLLGTYTRAGSDIRVSLNKVIKGATILDGNQAAIDMTITKIDDKNLEFISVVRRSGNRRSTICNR
jgi:hypothetical protein